MTKCRSLHPAPTSDATAGKLPGRKNSGGIRRLTDTSALLSSHSIGMIQFAYVAWETVPTARPLCLTCAGCGLRAACCLRLCGSKRQHDTLRATPW